MGCDYGEDGAHRVEIDIKKFKESNMSEPVNVFNTTPTPVPVMGGFGGCGPGWGGGFGGFGGDGIGALLAVALLGGGRFGGWGGGPGVAVDAVVGGCRKDCLTPEMAATTAMGLNTAIGATTAAVMAGTDKLSGGQMMLMNSTAAGFANQGQMTLQQSIMQIQQANANQSALLAELCGINQNVSAQGCQTREAVAADGDKTRAYLAARFQLEDQTEINKLNAKVIELQNEHRQRELGTKIEIQNTAIAAQQQGQQQQQQQAILHGVHALFPLVQGVFQHAQAAATNTSIIAGNSGAVVGGAQSATATPTNVNA